MALPEDLQTIEIRCAHCGKATVELDVDASQPLRDEINEKLPAKDWDTLDYGVCPKCMIAVNAEKAQAENSIPSRFSMVALILILLLAGCTDKRENEVQVKKQEQQEIVKRDSTGAYYQYH